MKNCTIIKITRRPLHRTLRTKSEKTFKSKCDEATSVQTIYWGILKAMQKLTNYTHTRTTSQSPQIVK